MEPKEQEKITSDALEAEKIGMKTFNYLCKMNILICCKTCNQLLTTNALIEKILRLKTGRIYFIIEEEDDNSELITKFKSLLLIKHELKINNNPEFSTVGINEVYCGNCKSLIGLKMKQTDETQIFMLNRIVLKIEALKFFIVEDLGIKPLHFFYKIEDLKNVDKEATEIEEYINQSGNQIQKFFDLLSSQTKDLRDIDSKKNDIDKLGDILKYLIDKGYI